MQLGCCPGIVQKVDPTDSGCLQLQVEVNGEQHPALAYPQLTGLLEPGEKVLLNTTAVDLNLGTGGFHFVIAKLGSSNQNGVSGPGHIIKLRYTPLQHKVLAVEEEDSPYHELMASCTHLDGMPVVAVPLHSLVAPAAAGVKAAAPGLRVAYIMTEGGALPLAFSRLTGRLKTAGLVDVTITVGQAFGGDLEAVNLYSGILAAKAVARADVAVVAMGPGNAGTNTAWGFSGIEQGQVLNAAKSLQGRPIAAPRLSFADPRPRHRGLSHHSRTVLGRVLLAPALVALPHLEPGLKGLVEEQIQAYGLRLHCEFIEVDGAPALDLLANKGIEVRSMGRTVDQDRVFFEAGGSAGRLAAELVLGEVLETGFKSEADNLMKGDIWYGMGGENPRAGNTL